MKGAMRCSQPVHKQHASHTLLTSQASLRTMFTHLHVYTYVRTSPHQQHNQVARLCPRLLLKSVSGNMARRHKRVCKCVFAKASWATFVNFVFMCLQRLCDACFTNYSWRVRDRFATFYLTNTITVSRNNKMWKTGQKELLVSMYTCTTWNMRETTSVCKLTFIVTVSFVSNYHRQEHFKYFPPLFVT